MKNALYSRFSFLISLSDRLFIDITPDKSLIKKLGLTGYRTEQALAELVDNSIDARIGGEKEIIQVKLDFDDREIVISDNGTGMDKNEIRDAMTIARGTKTAEKLGRFGIGMKSACSTLGKEFTITTSKHQSKKQYVAKYDEERWLSDKSQGWQNFELIEQDKRSDWHGTIIKISQLNVPLYPNQVSNFRDSFNIRYAPYLLQDQVQIQINSTYCYPDEPAIEEGTRKELDIRLPNGRHMRGWIGLLRQRSISGKYGIHLFKNGRLIKAHEKFGVRNHPEVAKIIGRLDLDHVPVNFHKSAFIEDSLEYEEAEKTFVESPIVKQILKEAMKRKQSIPTVKQVLEYIAGTAIPGILDTRISNSTSRQLLEQSEEFRMMIENNLLLFSFINDEKAPLYLIEKISDRNFQVKINRKNEAFAFFKNPLFLIGLIAIEAKIAIKDLKGYELLLNKRNTLWQQFATDWTKKEVKRRSRETQPPVLPNYSLAKELIELHEVLNEEFEGKFQFTSLSTLSKFVHNALAKVVFTVYTNPGMGQRLVELISQHVKENFVVLFNPKAKELELAMEVSGKTTFIAVREYAQFYGASFAEPEEAWVDFVVDIHKNKIPVSEAELKYVLQGLVHYNLVDRKRLISLLKRRKQLRLAGSIIEEVFE